MSGPAKLPTEAGLFGEVEKAPRERRAGASERVSSPTLFDLREQDAPGQVTIEDAIEDDERRRLALGGDPLRPEDMPELTGQRAAVHDLMRDGGWHDAEAIRQAAGGSEGLRRLRELRRWYTVEKRRAGDGRTFEYALRPLGSASPP